MAINKTNIFVYAHWLGMTEPKLIGILSAQQGKGRKSFSFEYEKEWLKSNQSFLLDPDIQHYSGPQFPVSKENFGFFLGIGLFQIGKCFEKTYLYSFL